MDKIQLKHPEGKKAPAIDKDKYDALKSALISCLNAKKAISFDDLLAGVKADLETRKIEVKGVIRWNLFWVTLDMEARNELKKNKTTSPYGYSIIPA